MQHPPIAPTKPHTHTEHGVERDDPWHWLRFREDPEVIAYIEAENTWKDQQTAHIADFHQALFEEMKGRIQETDQTPPVRDGDYWYYRRTVEGLSYGIHCRKKGSLEAEEEVVLDVNALAEGHDYTTVGAIAISPDHRLLAYAVDHTGRELFDVVVVDLASGEVVDDTLLATGGDITWATDNKTLLYTELDDTLRPWRIRRHALGSDPASDPLVLQETDTRFRLWTGRTRTDAYLVLGANSSKTTEVHVLPADQPEAAPRCLQPRHQGMRYRIAHHGDRFFIVTNDADDADGNHTDDAVNYKLMAMPVDGEGREDWVEVVPHRPDVELAGVAAFSGHLVRIEREAGLLHLVVVDLETSDTHRIELPEAAYDLGLERNPEFDTTELRFAYDSMVTPYTVFAYDMSTRERRTLKVTEVPGYDASTFATERIHATAPDGTAVPISMVYPKDFPRDGTGKLLLYGYGSYGITIDASFVSTRLVLLERGVAYAIAHPRGGGLLGQPWYESGKLEHKQNTFTDFIACARHLVDSGWTAPDRMAIHGGSAGGMLMGAVCNQAPELFHCCVAAVPFVDVVSTMLDESLPLTTNEWEEWGNPNERAAFDRMLSYSPYDNVEDTADYPDLLIVSGLNDPRVQYWEPTKWCAKLRATLTDPPQILLKTHMGAGHQGQSGRYGHLEDRAFEYAWFLDKLGLAD